MLDIILQYLEAGEVTRGSVAHSELSIPYLLLLTIYPLSLLRQPTCRVVLSVIREATCSTVPHIHAFISKEWLGFCLVAIIYAFNCRCRVGTSAFTCALLALYWFT